jgi:NCS1 family nucleobase:cation symporter-1
MSAPTGPEPDAVTVVADVREGEYGDRVAAVEPGGAEFIPLDERHGKPIALFWTWISPNLEFATVFVGCLPVLFFGQSLTMAILAILLGTGLGSFSQAVLAARGPQYGVPQMILSRIPFGFFGNVLPAGLNAVVAGIGWFAVNSVSGALALNALLHIPSALALLIVTLAQITIAFLGYNFIHFFERVAVPVLVIAFVLAAVWTLPKAGFAAPSQGQGLGGFLLTLGATFGYAAGWNPYASDYTRYLKGAREGRAAGWWSAAGIFLSCVLLEIVGAVSASGLTGKYLADNAVPTAVFVSPMPALVGDLVLLAIAIGAISANAINVYSGALSFLALGIKAHVDRLRAIVALVFGVVGFVVAYTALGDAGKKYEGFLLVISYWIGPWLAVVFVDQFLRRGHEVSGFLFDRRHNPIAGWASMGVGGAVSIWLFANQYGTYVGPVPTKYASFGDFTFEAGFVIAAVLYFVLYQLQRDRTDEVLVIPD